MEARGMMTGDTAKGRMDDKAAYAYEQIKDLVIHYHVGTDAPLSESYLVNLLQISRTPIRAALQQLQLEGFIYIIPKQGIVVRELGMDDAFQLLEMRQLVEKYLFSLSLRLLDEADFERMHQMVEEQKLLAEKRDYDAYLKADEQFHEYCSHKHENVYMKNFMRMFRDRFYTLRYQQITVPGRFDKAISEHESLIELCKAGRYEEACDLLESHTYQMRNLMRIRNVG